MKTSQRRRRAKAVRSSDDLAPGREAPGHGQSPLAADMAQTLRRAAQRRVIHAVSHTMRAGAEVINAIFQ